LKTIKSLYVLDITKYMYSSKYELPNAKGILEEENSLIPDYF